MNECLNLGALGGLPYVTRFMFWGNMKKLKTTAI